MKCLLTAYGAKWKDMKLSLRLCALLFSVLAILLFVNQLSCASKSHSSSRKGGIYHEVRPGQTLYRISLTYQVPLEEIVEANGINDPSLIRSGEKLFIPGVFKPIEVEILDPSIPEYAFLPVSGSIRSPFGAKRGRGRHLGIDITATSGTPILAVLPGEVIFSGWLSGYGRTVKVQHAGGYVSIYAHASKLLVSRGETVEKGQNIALVGRSGNATGYHLHFEIRKDDIPLNPLAFLSQQSATAAANKD